MYSARITRLNPTAFIFLIDQSGSLEEKMQFGTSLITKSEAVAMVTNTLIRELINRCRKEEGVMDYFEVAAIGYSSNEAKMLLGTKNSFMRPSVLDMIDCKKRVFTRERVLPNGSTAITTDELKYWIEPKAEGSTPMYSAMEQALQLASKWCKKASNNSSYPPTIINITDGEATDCDHAGLTDIAEQIKSLRTQDGNTLLMNINMSGASDHAILFPCSKEELPTCRYSNMLYEMSSEMPSAYNDSIERIKPGAKAPFRGMGLNTSIADIFAMMNIGSRSINNLI